MLNSVAKAAYKWYITDSKSYWNSVIVFLKFMDRDLGLVANIYNWTSPLYGDYSLIGKAIGPIFRTFRIILSGLAYSGIIVIAASFYALWLALPLGILAMIFLNLASLSK